MKKLLLGLLLLTGGMAYGQVNVGISIGVPPPMRGEVIAVRPAPDYYWVGGYWYPVGGQYVWHGGYWSRPPYSGAVWVAPRHDGHYYHQGYWNGNHGNVPHNHGWDNEHDRDGHHEGGEHHGGGENHGGGQHHGGGEHHEGHR